MYALNSTEIACISGAGVVADTLATFGEKAGEVVGGIMGGFISKALPDITIPLVDINIRTYVSNFINTFCKGQGKLIGNSIGTQIETWLPFLNK